MYTKSNFEEKNVAVEALKPLGSRYKFNNDAIDLVKERVNDLIAAAKSTGFVPDIVVHSSWITDVNGKFTEAAFTVKPTARVCDDASEFKMSFHVIANDSFYFNFIFHLARWADNYMLQTKYLANIAELQEVFDESLKAAEVPFEVKFKLGVGVLDVSDDYIEIGIPSNVAAELVTNDLFYSMIPGNLEIIRAKLGETIKTCTKPIDIVKLNNYILKSLGIYSRKQLKSIIRNIVTRKVQFSRVGESYVDTDKYFAVISKKAVTPDEAATLTGVYVIDNENATKAELNADKTKIAISYKVSPFNSDGVNVDVDIKDVEGIIVANKK